MKLFGWSLVIVLLLSVLVVAPATFPVRATVVYQPAVFIGQWAEYRPIYNICTVSAICQSSGNSLVSSRYAAIHVVDVSGENVTLSLISVSANGTGSQEGVLLNVMSGLTNVTILPTFPGMSTPSTTPSDYFVLAGGLRANDTIWNAVSAPRFNQTVIENVLGASRVVNFLNYTSAYSIYGYLASIRVGLAFDQESGVLIELAFSVVSAAGPFGSFQDAFALGMVDNNVWLSSVPDFVMSYGGQISFQAGSSGATTITIIPQHGFASTVSLRVISPFGLGCMPSKDRLPGYGSFTLICRGDPGTYQANITATGDSTSHSVFVPVVVSSAPLPNQPSSDLMLILYVGSGLAAIIVVLVAYLLLKRKPAQAATTRPSTTGNPHAS